MPSVRFESQVNDEFVRLLRALPPSVQRQARAAYRRFLNDPSYPGLQFKRVRTRLPVYAARVNDNYRVLGLREGDTIYWFWIGTHADYDRLLRGL